MVRCQVVDCDNDAEYYDYISGSAGDLRKFKVAVCKECYLDGWVIGRGEDREEQVRRILAGAEKIEFC